MDVIRIWSEYCKQENQMNVPARWQGLRSCDRETGENKYNQKHGTELNIFNIQNFYQIKLLISKAGKCTFCMYNHEKL